MLAYPREHMTLKIWWAREPRGTGVFVLVAVIWAKPRSWKQKKKEGEYEIGRLT